MTIERLTRRSAVRGAAVAAVGAVAGFAVTKATVPDEAARASAANGYGPAAGGSGGGKMLARLNDLPIGGGLVMGADAIVLTRTSGDDVRAFSATCTHQGCTVSTVAQGLIECPCHGSAFDAATGAVVTGPATIGLAPVTVVVSGDAVYTS